MYARKKKKKPWRKTIVLFLWCEDVFREIYFGWRFDSDHEKHVKKNDIT